MGEVLTDAGKEQNSDEQRSRLARIVDAALFVTVLGFSAVALLALAVAAPLALAVSAIAGAFSKDRARRGWRVAHHPA